VATVIDFVRNQNLTQPDPKSTRTLEALSKKAYSLHRKGDALFVSSRFARSWETYQKSLEAYREGGDLQGTAMSLTRQGRVAEILGEYDQARDLYGKSLKIFQDLTDLQGMARSKAHLGNVGWSTGDYMEASKFLEEALSLYRVAEDVAGEAWVFDLMGNLRLAMRQDDEAESFYNTAFSLVEGLGVNLENTAWNHYHLGAVAFFREQAPEAKEKFLEALKCFLRLKDRLGQAATHIHLGEIACAQKNTAEAGKNLQKAVRLVVPTHCKPLVADVLAGVAQLLKLQGDERKAISILMVALSHPTCRQQTKDRMVALAASLEARFSPKEAQEGFHWAKTVPLEKMATSWASSITRNPKN
jgi:tetratricopeptide (TPR) repeat protein